VGAARGNGTPHRVRPEKEEKKEGRKKQIREDVIVTKSI